MAITLVGTSTASAINGAEVVLTLPSGMAKNDVVYVLAAGHRYVDDDDIGTSSSGWTRLLDGFFGAVCSVVFRKVMTTATPDTSITITYVASSADDAGAAIAYVFRGVDLASPEDATTTQQNFSATQPDSPSITTVTNNAWVLSFVTINRLDSTVTSPSGYTDQLFENADDVEDVTVAGALKVVATAGVENPGAWSNWASGAGFTYTVAVRPSSVPRYDLDGDAGSFALTGTAATLTWIHQVVASPGSFDVTGADVTLVKGIDIDVDAGSYALTGSSTNWWMMASAGSFGVTGSTAELQFSGAPILEADAGSFAVTGTAAGLQYGFKIDAGVSSFAVTGADASLSRNSFINVDAGSYFYVGESVDFTVTVGTISFISHPVAWGPIGGLADPASQPLMTEQIGAVLACTNGVWTSLEGLPLSYSYQWRRNGVDICDAILNAYTLEQADSGAAIDCEVTVTDGTFTASEDSNNIICETEVFPVRTHYRKVTGMHSGGTLTFTRTIEDAPCPPDPDPDPGPNPDPDPDPDPGEEGGFIIDANSDFVVDIDEFFLTDATS